MKSNYNFCIQEVLKSEGGYTNDPQDPGGPTNFGITIIDYRKYIDSKGTATSVRNMSLAQAKAIYKSKYWDALSCDALPSGVDYTCFDYGVNSGLGRPRKALQRFKGKSGVDLINAINDERLAFLRALKTFPRFGKGWTSRVTRVRSDSIKLATKKDVVTAPSTGAAAGIGAYATALQYIHNHPYLIAAGAVIIGALVWMAIHAIRNNK